MKISLKNKGNIIIASLLVALFFLLHYFVYLDNSAGSIPIIQSSTDAPVDMPELFLWEENKPSYLNPFRKVQFVYEDTKTQETVIEEAESMFSSKMQPLIGDPYDYWDGFDEDGFGRPQVGYTYANLFFFIIQYLLIATFIFILFRPGKSKV